MNAALVVEICAEMERLGVPFWIDGGWCVDALLGYETRTHGDLDIVVEMRDVPTLRDALISRGFRDDVRGGATPWNFVLADAEGNAVDVHAINMDEQGRGVLGPPALGQFYPAGALDGVGAIKGRPVRCIAAKHMVQFKTSFEQRAIDRADVAALCARFGIEVST